MLANNQQPLIVISAPNGARLTQAEHPTLPITPAELATEAERLVEAGVSVLHLHVRDELQKHSLDPNHYLPAIEAIKNKVGDQLIIQITTEAVGMYDRHQQMAAVRAIKPEAASIALRELCPGDECMTEAIDFFIELKEQQCWTQFILYDLADLEKFEKLREAGLLGWENPFALFVLGRYAENLLGNPQEIYEYLEHSYHKKYPWAMCCFGHTESEAATIASNENGHVRIGFENNQKLSNLQPAQNNADLVSHTLDIIKQSGCQRELATADWIRSHLI